MNKVKHSALIGAHVSIAKGLDQAIFIGESIGCSAIQIFTHSNRQWLFKPIVPQNIEKFIHARDHSSIIDVVVHASYLLNCATSDPQIREKTISSLCAELDICEKLLINSIVVHPGSCSDSINDCLQRVANTIDEVYDQFLQQKRVHIPCIVLETMAGQGNSVGNTFEQLHTIRQLCRHKKYIKYCVDTAHTFAAGYDWRGFDGYSKIIDLINTILGIDLIAVIHVNDTKKLFNSHVDRHDHIGKGEIGVEAFRLLVNDTRFASVPKILETPYESIEELAVDVSVLRSLIKK